MQVAHVVMLVALGGTLSQLRAQDSGRGFLFGRPDGSVTLRGGFARASAGSDLFEDARKQLTLGSGAFNSAALGGDVAFTLRNDLDVVLGVDWSASNRRSEFRDYVDNKQLPIEQTTSLARLPITASLKWYLAQRGRSIGRFAWIPSRYAPYVGAGAGLTWYQFDQDGDFVDYKTLNVFSHHYESSDWGFTAHAFAGFDYSINQRFGITTQGRYSWARADLGPDFSGFKPIDLSGFTTSVGFFVRY